MKKDPQPLSPKFAAWFAAGVVLLLVGGPGVYLLLAAGSGGATLSVAGGLLLIGTAVTLAAMLLRTG